MDVVFLEVQELVQFDHLEGQGQQAFSLQGRKVRLDQLEQGFGDTIIAATTVIS